MAEDLIPFNILSRDALVQLVQKANPQEKIEARYVEFGDLYADPTPEEPGRTFIEMTNLVTKKKGWFAYRRLDIDLVIQNETPLRVKTPITAIAIVNELNRSRGLLLSAQDLDLSPHLIEAQTEASTWTLTIRADSPRYYGQEVMLISPIVVNQNIMRREDDVLMQQEDGTFMIVEEVPAVA